VTTVCLACLILLGMSACTVKCSQGRVFADRVGGKNNKGLRPVSESQPAYCLTSPVCF